MIPMRQLTLSLFQFQWLREQTVRAICYFNKFVVVDELSANASSSFGIDVFSPSRSVTTPNEQVAVFLFLFLLLFRLQQLLTLRTHRQHEIRMFYFNRGYLLILIHQHSTNKSIDKMKQMSNNLRITKQILAMLSLLQLFQANYVGQAVVGELANC
jgi:hypothetical protein